MGKVWLVTGCSRGLGRDIAKAILASGDKLVATARKASDLHDLVSAHPERAIAVALDVTDAAAAPAAVDSAVRTFGRLDVVVNNAGFANVVALEDISEADFRAQFETNFFGVFHVTRAALPVLRAQKSGHVIQISTIGGRLGSPGFGAYQSSKWAVEAFSEALRAEVASFGINVTIVEPGSFRTDFARASMRFDEPSAAYKSTIGPVAEHVRRSGDAQRGDPAKAAKAILALAAMEKPPLRLLLGADAFTIARSVAENQKTEDLANRDLSFSTDFDDAEPFEQTAMYKAFVRTPG